MPHGHGKAWFRKSPHGTSLVSPEAGQPYRADDPSPWCLQIRLGNLLDADCQAALGYNPRGQALFMSPCVTSRSRLAAPKENNGMLARSSHSQQVIGLGPAGLMLTPCGQHGEGRA